MITSQTFLFALLGGILPALLWLWFWLREDKVRPEPRGIILLSFISGMLVIGPVILLEQAAAYISVGMSTIILWASIEELAKYGIALLVVLRRKSNDEPIDAIIYMITIALGFAALENALFLMNPLFDGNIIGSILTGNLRFIGATLLHTLASAVIGVAMALSFYKTKLSKRIYVTIGIILAIVLHSLFNLSIIRSDATKDNGEGLLIIFFAVWIGIVALILIFEKVKKIYNRDLIK